MLNIRKPKINKPHLLLQVYILIFCFKSITYGSKHFISINYALNIHKKTNSLKTISKTAKK